MGQCLKLRGKGLGLVLLSSPQFCSSLAVPEGVAGVRSCPLLVFSCSQYVPLVCPQAFQQAKLRAAPASLGLKAAFCSSGSAPFPQDGNSWKDCRLSEAWGASLLRCSLNFLFCEISALSALGLLVCPLQAWNKFVNISFPDEQFTQTWRNTLLADLKKRIQQVGLGEVDMK